MHTQDNQANVFLLEYEYLTITLQLCDDDITLLRKCILFTLRDMYKYMEQLMHNSAMINENAFGCRLSCIQMLKPYI